MPSGALAKESFSPAGAGLRMAGQFSLAPRAKTAAPTCPPKLQRRQEPLPGGGGPVLPSVCIITQPDGKARTADRPTGVFECETMLC